MKQSIDLPAGTLHYDTYGDPGGEPVVFVHGFAIDGRVWTPVAERLAAAGLHCLVPTWPFGSHTTPMRPDAELAPPAAARLVNDFLAALGLERVTIVGNDSGGAVVQLLVTQLLTSQDRSRIGRLVLTNCDSFENFPPGVFKLMSRMARIPGVGTAMLQPMRFERFLRGTSGYGALTTTRLPTELLRSFIAPMLTDRGVRRDALKFFGAADARDTIAAGALLPQVDVPALLVWGADDTFFTLAQAERIAAALPDATLVPVPDAKTYVSLDQPEVVADAIAAFVSPRVSQDTV
ncbi:MAG: alpha/beta hydrolase [Nocardioidaceae bacterium]|nr:alpha/beta hydrolase [Nocardioidaceae bacterium]